MPYQVTERLYVDAAGKVYTQDELTERSEAVLLATEGSELSDADAQKYGLSAKAKAAPEIGQAEPDPRPEADDDEPEAETKAVEGAPANKARAASEKK